MAAAPPLKRMAAALAVGVLFVAVGGLTATGLFNPAARAWPSDALMPVPPGPLVGARAIAGGQDPTDRLTRIGPGRMPDASQATALTYGALLYDADPKSGIYVLYGIGKHEDDAIVVGVATNGTGTSPAASAAPKE